MSIRARDIIGRRIVAVKQQRFSNYEHLGEMGYSLDWLELDDGSAIYFSAVETEAEPFVEASLVKKARTHVSSSSVPGAAQAVGEAGKLTSSALRGEKAPAEAGVAVGALRPDARDR